MAFPRPRPARPELPRQRVQSLQCGQGAVRAARFNADGNYCLTCGSDKTLKLWNPHKGTALRTYQGHGYEVLDAAGSFDNSQICSGGADKAVALWDVSTGQVVRKYRGHAGKVNCVQFNEEATVIVSGSIDSTVRCWDCRSRRPDPIQVLDEAKDGISSVKLSAYEILTGPHHQRVLQQGRAVRAGRQPGLHIEAAGQGHRGAAGRVHGPPQHHVQAGLRPQRAGHARGLRLRGRPRLLLGPAGGLSGAQAARGPGCGAVLGLPPQPALPAGGHAGPGDAVARGHLPARGGPRHLRGSPTMAGTPVRRGINPHGDPAVLYWELE
ncbi:WD repeat domain-containing protein 83 isoform X1 [Zonotrichia leucophrys gambelii]|uniref:WD repeat domain-containing protein 83 isoform X1 n=1 Tax=Zonotrichia leucophrys gambelii TaxID=257770 RepID=UPI00313FF7AD